MMIETVRLRLLLESTAHKRPEHGASARVLGASGVERVGDVLDPEDGLVWRWEFVPLPASSRRNNHCVRRR